MRLIIIGALGHIGSALIRQPELVDSANQLTLVDNLSTQRYSSLFHLPDGPRYTLLTGDARDVVDASMLDGADAVIHLAAVSDPGAAYRDPVGVATNNLSITRHLADECSRANVPLVFASSTSVYSGGSSIVYEDSPHLSPTGKGRGNKR